MEGDENLKYDSVWAVFDVDGNQTSEKHVKDYDKHVEFERFKDGYAEAVTRAMRLDEPASAVAEPGRNPTTGVYKLTESIRVDGALNVTPDSSA